MEAHVTAQSQSFRLRERASEAQIRHGQDVRVDLPHVRVGVAGRMFEQQERSFDRGEIFFCQMGRIRVREILTNGDDAELPDTVIADGLDVPQPGYYDLLNVLVRSNGDIRLVVDSDTKVEPASWPTEAIW